MTDIAFVFLAAVLFLIMILGNKKVRVCNIFIRQLKVFKNNKTKRFSLMDMCCFVIFPIIIAFILVYRFAIVVTPDLASTLTTVFALVFTVLFGFATILVGKLNSNNKIEKEVVGETFVSIMSATILSLVATVVAIVGMMNNNPIIQIVVSLVLMSISLMILMLVLLISKRTFIIYDNNTDK